MLKPWKTCLSRSNGRRPSKESSGAWDFGWQAGEFGHVPCQRLVAGDDGAAYSAFGFVDDAKGAQVGAGGEDGIAGGLGGDLFDGGEH